MLKFEDLSFILGIRENILLLDFSYTATHSIYATNVLTPILFKKTFIYEQVYL